MNNIQLYKYNLEMKQPLQVLGYNSKYRQGFLLIKETSDGYQIGEVAPLPSFHKTSFIKIKEELRFFIAHNYLSVGSHALSHFAIDMLNSDVSKTDPICTRTTNALYHPNMSKEEIQKYKVIKLKVGRQSIEEDIETIKTIIDIHPNLRLRLDANGLWTFDNCLYFWNVLSQRDLDKFIEYIEDPLQNIEKNIHYLDHIPIAFDELFSISNLQYNPVAIILKPTIQGGLFECQRIQQLITDQNKNIQVVISSTFESSIGIKALMNLASATEVHGLGTLQYFYSDRDLLQRPIEQIGDQLIAYNQIYTPEDLNWDLLEKI